MCDTTRKAYCSCQRRLHVGLVELLPAELALLCIGETLGSGRRPARRHRNQRRPSRPAHSLQRSTAPQRIEPCTACCTHEPGTCTQITCVLHAQLRLVLLYCSRECRVRLVICRRGGDARPPPQLWQGKRVKWSLEMWSSCELAGLGSKVPLMHTAAWWLPLPGRQSRLPAEASNQLARGGPHAHLLVGALNGCWPPQSHSSVNHLDKSSQSCTHLAQLIRVGAQPLLHRIHQRLLGLQHAVALLLDLRQLAAG